MRAMRWFTAGLLVAGVCAATALAAGAAPARTWQKIGTTPSTAEPGMARSADGVLHVVFATPSSASTTSLVHVAIPRGGHGVGKPTQIVSDWAALNPSVALLAQPDGRLRVFFAGLDSTSKPGPTFAKLATSTAPRSGATWSPAVVGNGGSQFVAQASGIGAGTTKDGTFVEAWGGSGPGYSKFHFGVGGSNRGVQIQSRCCATDPQLATDATSGKTYLAWYSLGHPAGVTVREVGPTGFAGKPAVAPGSAAFNPLERTAITGRLGAGGVFVAYGAGSVGDPTELRLWQVGAGAPVTLATGGYFSNVGVGPLAGGRLWLLWESRGMFHAACTDRAATKLGPVTTFSRPGNLPDVSRVSGLEGLAYGRTLDVVALSQPGGKTPGTRTLWHTRIRLACR